MKHWMNSGVFFAPNDDGGGGLSLDELLGLSDPPAGDPPAGDPPGQPGFQLSDDLIDKIADRIVQKQSPAPASQPAQPAPQGNNPFEGNEFLQNFANVIRGQVLQDMSPTLIENSARSITQLGMPAEVVQAVQAELAKMPAAEVVAMRQNGGDVILAKAIYADLVMTGKIAPPNQPGNQGERGDAGGPPAGANETVRSFYDTFVGMHGRQPTADDAKRWGVKL